MSDFKKFWKSGDLDKETEKTQVEKPGPSIHSDKWDRCVKEVTENGNADNAFSVCTAQLGEESFKSQYRHFSYAKGELTKARREVEKLGIGYAGPIPNSLLAGQDLEGPGQRETTEKSAVERPAAVRSDDLIEVNGKTYRVSVVNKQWVGARQRVTIFGIDIKTGMKTSFQYDGDDSVMLKNMTGKLFSTTANELYTIREEALKAESTETKEELAGQVKSIQIKRQKAEINTRKSFNNFWKTNKI